MPVRSRTRRGAGSLFSEPAPFQSGTLEIVTPRPVTILGSEERHLHLFEDIALPVDLPAAALK